MFACVCTQVRLMRGHRVSKSKNHGLKCFLYQEQCLAVRVDRNTRLIGSWQPSVLFAHEDGVSALGVETRGR